MQVPFGLAFVRVGTMPKWVCANLFRRCITHGIISKFLKQKGINFSNAKMTRLGGVRTYSKTRLEGDIVLIKLLFYGIERTRRSLA